MPTFQTSVTFSPEEIENILKQYVVSELRMDVSTVSINVQNRSIGYGPGESSEAYLANIVVSGVMTK